MQCGVTPTCALGLTDWLRVYSLDVSLSSLSTDRALCLVSLSVFLASPLESSTCSRDE